MGLEDAIDISEAKDFGINWWLVGPPGATKTSLAATLGDHPRGRDVLVLDGEGGSGVLQEFGNHIKVIPITTWPHLLEIYTNLVEQDHNYKTIIIDNMTEFNKISIRHAQDTSDDPSEKDPNRPTLRAYLGSSNQMGNMIRKFRDLGSIKGMNVVFCSWIAREQDQISGAITYEVDLGRSLQSQVPGIVDVVGYLSRNDEGTPILKLVADRQHPTIKFRRRNSAAWTIPDEIEQPTLAPVLEVMKEGTLWEEAIKMYPFIHPKDRIKAKAKAKAEAIA